ncbi:receptor activity-modifying protein 2 [Anolis carolinensis]|uniref:Receptor activity-modifying protein 2 n=1 Tax=Anolis carolinensis TaxID=28377 RepID=G1KPU5_ANOCA|nr:PREDICTED: receptor activity-modifying protein 2 [Anolis carolinensis]|eukprot:XP_003222434.1 PREDICTED: receptor activity-modifying protein 2 [Anolis carolinensis]
MEGQCLPLQLLLLVFTVTIGLDAYSGTVAPPSNASLSLEGGPNVTAPNYHRNLEGNSTIDVDIYYYLAEDCWLKFYLQMTNVSKEHLCEWRAIGRPYSILRKCLEDYADKWNYGFPNALAEYYIVLSHHLYFRNCTSELHPPFLDPPENILLPLIITPICLIPFLITLVVLKSKDGETQA